MKSAIVVIGEGRRANKYAKDMEAEGHKVIRRATVDTAKCGYEAYYVMMDDDDIIPELSVPAHKRCF